MTQSLTIPTPSAERPDRKPLRILQLKAVSGRGGAETLVIALTRHFVDQGHSVHTILGEHGWLTGQFVANGFAVTHAPMSGLPQLRSVLRLLRIIRDTNPSVILAHGARANLISAAASFLTRVPTVSVEHCVDNWRSTSWLRNALDRLSGRINMRRIAVSSAVAEVLETRSIVPKHKVTIVSNGVPCPKSLPEPRRRRRLRAILGIAEGSFAIVTVARLSAQKGHKYLLAAVPTMLAEYPDTKIVLIGDGDQRCSLETQMRDAGVQSAVTLLGAIDNVPDLLEAFDLFLLPSLWEGLPVALLEAMAAGLPAMATSVDGSREVITNGYTGFLVPPRDSGSIARTYKRVRENAELLAQIAAQGREHVLRRYSSDEMLTSYLRILNEVVTAR